MCNYTDASEIESTPQEVISLLSAHADMQSDTIAHSAILVVDFCVCSL